MRAICFKAPEQLAEELSRRAVAERRTMAEVIRRAVFIYLYLNPLDLEICWQKALDDFRARVEGKEVKPARLKFKG